MSCSARTGPKTTGSRHVDATTRRIADHPARARKNARPSRRRKPGRSSTTSIAVRRTSVAIPSSAWLGIDGIVGPSEPHGPGPT